MESGGLDSGIVGSLSGKGTPIVRLPSGFGKYIVADERD
jgi:hypothetical protein